MIVPTLCVGMLPGTFRVPSQSVTGCIPTRSMGMIKLPQEACVDNHSRCT